mgnify:CR=1 FL=1
MIDQKSEKNTADTADFAAEQKPQKKVRKKKGKKKWIKWVVILLVVLIVGGLFLMPKKTVTNVGSTVYSLSKAERRSITASLTGTGTLNPIEYHNITASVTGDIISADFEEMDEVQKDDVLYIIDSTDLEDDIEDLERDVADALKDYRDALEDYDDLKIRSDVRGKILELYVEEGDNVQSGMAVARIIDDDTMLLKIPFFSANADHMSVGDSAVVTFGDTGETLSGSVSEISALTTVGATGAGIREITIAVKNPGGITVGRKAYASVTSGGTEYTCSDSGAFEYSEDKTITAEASGKAETVYFEKGQYVNKNSLIVSCTSETLDKQVEQLKKTYDNQQKRLEKMIDSRDDYIIKAPISGTIVQKNYKELDTIGSSSMSSTTVLAMIYDMSKLELKMNIDELDLAQIREGQSVRITSDSVAGTEFVGTVTKKSIVGTTSNGTTVYPVTIEIDGNDSLLPGMNVNAEIITENAEDVLTVPLTAVDRGNRVKVYKGTDASLDTPLDTAPEYETVEVETGISDDNYIEIKSGLAEGDIVVVEKTNVAAKGIMDMMYSGGMGDVDNGPPSGGGPDGNGGGPGGGGYGGGAPSGGGGSGGGRPGM